MTHSFKPDAAPDTCQATLVNAEAVERARRLTPKPAVVADLAELFSLLSDPTRVRIVTWLRTQELCVCDLAALLGVTQSAVSHQLRLLRAQRVVTYRREGKMAFYSLDDDHVSALLDVALTHIQEG